MRKFSPSHLQKQQVSVKVGVEVLEVIEQVSPLQQEVEEYAGEPTTDNHWHAYGQ